MNVEETNSDFSGVNQSYISTVICRDILSHYLMTHKSLNFNVAAATLSESFEHHSFVNLVFLGNY